MSEARSRRHRNDRVRSRRAALVAALLAATAGLTFPARAAQAPTRAVDGRIDDWRGTSSGLGGTTQISNGELVYQDHLYDDLGAHTQQRAEQYGTVQNPTGDVRYPTDDARYGRNAADLLELRLTTDGTDLFVLARLNTLKVDDSTVVALALDTTEDTRTATGVTWPHGAGVDVPGADHVITLWGTGGDVTDLRTNSSTDVETAVDTSNDDNAIEARIPLRTLDVSPDQSLRVWAATGLWTGDAWMPIALRQSATEPGGASPTKATPPIFNVAFRDHETGSFFEELQSAALAAGDLEPFSTPVDLADLTGEIDRPYRPESGRFYAVILDTGIEIDDDQHTTGGEGVAYTGMPGRFEGAAGAALAQEFNFFGRHQPYGLYLPKAHGDGKEHPAALVLHGLGGSHASYNKGPGFLADMGEGEGTGLPSMYLITPLARGSSFYADWGEAETLRVLEDAHRRAAIDDDRLYLTGYSMGGYGVYRLASLYPDRFAAAGVWAGYTGEVTGSYLTPVASPVSNPVGRPNQGKANIGDPVMTMENLRHLPLMLSSGTNDEIVPTPGQYATINRLRALGYRNRWDLYPGYDHFAFGLLDTWQTVRAYLGDQRRADAPRHITHRFSDGWTLPDVASTYGLDHGNAWWLHDLTMRETTDDAFTLATVDAVSHGIAGGEPTVVDAPPTAATEPTPHTIHDLSWAAPAVTEPASNQLDLTLTGVGAGRIDLAPAGLSLCGLTLVLTTDGPVALTLTSPVTTRVFVTGAPGATFDVRGHVLQVPAAGSFAIRFRCPPR
jgi:predicted esterase